MVDVEETRRRPSSYEGNDRKNKRQVRNVAFSDTESEFSESESEQSNFRSKRKSIRKANNNSGTSASKSGITNQNKKQNSLK